MITRKIDSLGRIVIPKEMRRLMSLDDNKSHMSIEYKDGTVILKPYQINCIFCSSSDNIVSFKEMYICQDCIEVSKTL